MTASRNLGLDVVRALAILLVLVAHYSTVVSRWIDVTPPDHLLSVGGMGVELFFALSGYLIGRLLIDIARTQPSGRELLIFLVRRWMRTLPLYYVWLAFLLLVMPPRAGLYSEAAAYATLSQNLAWPMPTHGWFAVSWSLTIEEWFYLGFGTLAVAAALLLRTRNALWFPVGVFLIVPPLLRWMAPERIDIDTGIRDVVVYRLDAIVWGVVMADLTTRNLSVAWRLTLLGAGLALSAALWGGCIAPPPRLDRTFTFDLMAIGFALCLPGAELLGRTWRWFAAIARALSAQSYALYLMHLSILQALDVCLRKRHLFGFPLALALALMLPFALSWASFHYFESPILARRPRQQARPALAGEPMAVAEPAIAETGN